MGRVDLVLFGASGFTGRHAARCLAGLARSLAPLTWAVAGRDRHKLEDLLKDIAETTGEDVLKVPVIVADVNDQDSLVKMCSQARAVANFCGPYRRLGEPVVQAAITAKAHYLDVCGEPQFMETMFLKYDEQAREAGVCVVCACGLDSVPNDMGVEFVRQKFDGTVNSIESYFSFVSSPAVADEAKRGVIHYGTWDSLVHSVEHANELKPLRQKMFPDKMTEFKPKLQKRFPVHRRDAAWAVPFLGADNSIVYRSQRALYAAGSRPIQFKAYLTLPSLVHVVVLALAGLWLFVATRFQFLKRLLLDHPRVFSLGTVSHEGPTQRVMDNTHFSVTLHAEGWGPATDVTRAPDKRVVGRVSGVNPGYGATAAMLVWCAITILNERHNLPQGGVMTTAVAFRNTSLIKNLNDNGIKFEIIETTTA